MQSVFRYLGLDEETKRTRRETQTNLERASQALEQLQVRFASASRKSESSREELKQAMRDSEFNFGKSRRRTAGA